MLRGIRSSYSWLPFSCPSIRSIFRFSFGSVSRKREYSYTDIFDKFKLIHKYNSNSPSSDDNISFAIYNVVENEVCELAPVIEN